MVSRSAGRRMDETGRQPSTFPSPFLRLPTTHKRRATLMEQSWGKEGSVSRRVESSHRLLLHSTSKTTHKRPAMLVVMPRSRPSPSPIHPAQEPFEPFDGFPRFQRFRGKASLPHILPLCHSTLPYPSCPILPCCILLGLRLLPTYLPTHLLTYLPTYLPIPHTRPTPLLLLSQLPSCFPSNPSSRPCPSLEQHTYRLTYPRPGPLRRRSGCESLMLAAASGLRRWIY